MVLDWLLALVEKIMMMFQMRWYIQSSQKYGICISNVGTLHAKKIVSCTAPQLHNSLRWCADEPLPLFSLLGEDLDDPHAQQ